MQKLITRTISTIFIIGICSTHAMAGEFDANEVQSACAIADDTYIRDYPTFKPVAKLNRGECMDLIPNEATGAPMKFVVRSGERYYLVRGISGNVRVLSTRYSELK